MWQESDLAARRVVNAAHFLRLLSCFLLVVRCVGLAPGLYFYLYFFFNVLDLKMHPYCLTATWQALRGCEPGLLGGDCLLPFLG